MDGGRQRSVGLLGGSFDPPHEGHLWMARRARDVWQLDEVWLLPAFRPPHKDSRRQTDYRHRAAMAALLAGEEPWLLLCEIEKERGGTSYTLDTLRALKRRHGDGTAFHLIIGGDSLAELDTWRDPEEICNEARLLVLAREGSVDPGRFPCEIDRAEQHPAQSRLIRAAIEQGGSAGWLTPPVAAYIAREGLYPARQS